MPVTPEQAISAAMRGVMRSLHDAPPEGSVEEYDDFIRHVHDSCGMTRHALFSTIQSRRGDDAAIIKSQTDQSYICALGMAVTSLLALAHHPHLAEIDEALPGESLES